jgi:hypothetical protein
MYISWRHVLLQTKILTASDNPGVSSATSADAEQEKRMLSWTFRRMLGEMSDLIGEDGGVKCSIVHHNVVQQSTVEYSRVGEGSLEGLGRNDKSDES